MKKDVINRCATARVSRSDVPGVIKNYDGLFGFALVALSRFKAVFPLFFQNVQNAWIHLNLKGSGREGGVRQP